MDVCSIWSTLQGYDTVSVNGIDRFSWEGRATQRDEIATNTAIEWARDGDITVILIGCAIAATAVVCDAWADAIVPSCDFTAGIQTALLPVLTQRDSKTQVQSNVQEHA
jgi:hypothetical protein